MFLKKLIILVLLSTLFEVPLSMCMANLLAAQAHRYSPTWINWIIELLIDHPSFPCSTNSQYTNYLFSVKSYADINC